MTASDRSLTDDIPVGVGINEYNWLEDGAEAAFKAVGKSQ
jgi:hypothetical protein